MEILNSPEAQSALFEVGLIGILVINDQDEIVLANSAARKMFGYENAELKDRSVGNIIPAFRNLVTQERKKSNAGAMADPVELQGKKKSGSELSVEVLLSPFQSEKRNFIAVFIGDCNARKQAERVKYELEGCSQQLQHLTNEMKEFNYVSSHHLQEPLRKMQTYGGMLLKEEPCLSDQGKEYLKKVLLSAEVMRERINSFILFTRPGIKEQIRVPSNLRLILKHVLEDLDILISREKAEIRILTDLPVIHADPVQLGKLFLNLISNAIKFHKPGIPPVIKIRHRFLPAVDGEKKEKIEIEFEDNGIGFDDLFSEELFHLFKKNVESEGQGIGLAISRKICRLHGGNLRAKSQIGKGSKFIATLATR